MATLNENVAKVKENFRNIRDAINDAINVTNMGNAPLTDEDVDQYADLIRAETVNLQATGYSTGYEEGVTTGIEAGKIQQQNEFAESYQAGGEREVYYYAYAGAGWNDYTFEQSLMYDIVPNSCNQMFYQSRVRDVAGIMKRKGVKFDFNTKEPTQCFSMFTNSYVEYLPEIIMPTNSTAYGLCENCTKLKEIEGLVCNEKTAFQTTSGNNKSFQSCTALEHCIFSGVIANDIDVHWSTLLDTESVVSLAVTAGDFITSSNNPSGVEIGELFTKTIIVSAESLAILKATEFPPPEDTDYPTGYSCYDILTIAKGWLVEG